MLALGGAVVASRGVSQTLTATPAEWALRLVQFVNANYAGTDTLSTSVPALGLAMVALLAVAGVAVVRRRYLWLFALSWTVVAAAPYALVSHGPDLEVTPVLALGVRGDRFLYTSASGASLLLVASGRWLLDELVGGRWLPLVRGAAVAAVAGLLLLHGVRLQAAEDEWDTAGGIVRQVTSQVKAEWPQPAAGDTLCLAGLPHTYGGKPVYRNGVAESIFLAYGRDDFAVERLEHLQEPTARARCSATFVYVGLARGLVKARLVTGLGPTPLRFEGVGTDRVAAASRSVEPPAGLYLAHAGGASGEAGLGSGQQHRAPSSRTAHPSG